METEFQPNEQSIKDMVAREMQEEVSKLQNVSAPAKKKQPLAICKVRLESATGS